ncbi:MAG: S1 family peptidase [Pseudobdellovibrionaceae bacterium]
MKNLGIILSLSTLLILSLFGCSAEKNAGTANEDEGNKVLTATKTNICIPAGSKPSLPSAMNGITGGDKLQPTNPFAKKVVMLLSTEGNETIPTCTATPVAPNILLTAAHCVVDAVSIDKDVKKIKVAIHTDLTCESGFDAKTQVLTVNRILMHEKYSYMTKVMNKMDNDVALIKLDSPLPMDYQVSTLYKQDEVLDDKQVVMVGYGQSDIGDKNSAGYLRMKMKISTFGQGQDLTSDGKLLLIAKSDGGSCNGDSGGPLFVKSKGVWKIAGIVSGSQRRPGDINPCGDIGIYGYVPYYADWIEMGLFKLQ